MLFRSRTYRSSVDPRLNYEQALEMAFLIARRLAANAPDRSFLDEPVARSG